MLQVGGSQPPHFYLKNQSRSLSHVKNYLNNNNNNGVAQIFWLPWCFGTVVFAAFQIPNIDVANFTWKKKK